MWYTTSTSISFCMYQSTLAGKVHHYALVFAVVIALESSVLLGIVPALAVDTTAPTLSGFTVDKSVAGYRRFSITAMDAGDTDLMCTLSFEGPANYWSYQANMNKSGGYYSAVNVPIGPATMRWKANCIDDSNNETDIFKTFTFTSPQVSSVAVTSRETAGKRSFTAVANDFNNSTTVTDGLCKFYLDGVLKYNAQESGADTGYYLSNSINVSVGSHTVKAECTNTANMVNSKEYSWTAAAPANPSIVESSNPNGTAFSFAVVAYDYNNPLVIDTCALSIDGQSQGVVTESSSNSGTFNSGSLPLSGGQHTATVLCDNGIGNTGQGSVTFTALGPDTIKPVIQSLSIDSTVPGARTLTIVATDDRDTSLLCTYGYDGVPAGGFTQSGGSTSYVKTGFTVTAGAHTFVAYCTDDAGNGSEASSQTWTFADGPPPDTTRPLVTAIAVDATVAGARTVTITASDTVDSNLTCKVYVNDEFAATASKTADTTYRANVTIHNPGFTTLKAVCADDAANSNDLTKQVTFTDPPPENLPPVPPPPPPPPPPGQQTNPPVITTSTQTTPPVGASAGTSGSAGGSGVTAGATSVVGAVVVVTTTVTGTAAGLPLGFSLPTGAVVLSSTAASAENAAVVRGVTGQATNGFALTILYTIIGVIVLGVSGALFWKIKQHHR